MSKKPVIPRLVAEDDLDQAFNYYLDSAGGSVAEQFATDTGRTIGSIAEFPTLGSPRYSFETGLDGVRFWPLKKFPYLIFYTEEEHHIDVWRVLHSHMNIPEHLSSSE